MKLHEQLPAGIHLISRYGAGVVEIGGRQLTAPLIVAPSLLHEAWIPAATELTAESLAPLWAVEPRIVLLGGSGFDAALVKPLRRALTARQAGLEVMDLGAACRTYNVLAQEERAVAALLFPA